jgi:predicted nuclease of predicted toxin-antitoxin system
MRVLLDESLPKKLGFLLEGHFVRTVQQMGFAGLANGKLLAAAANDFDVLITGDQNMEYQQNQSTLAMGVIVLVAPSNKLESFAPLVPTLLKALSGLVPKSFQVIETA